MGSAMAEAKMSGMKPPQRKQDRPSFVAGVAAVNGLENFRKAAYHASNRNAFFATESPWQAGARFMRERDVSYTRTTVVDKSVVYRYKKEDHERREMQEGRRAALLQEQQHASSVMDRLNARATLLMVDGTSYIENQEVKTARHVLPDVRPELGDSAVLLATVSAILGGAMGVVFAMAFSGRFSSLPSTATMKDHMKDYVRQVGDSARVQGASFAVFGALITGMENVASKVRGSHDLSNVVLAGCAAGGLLGSAGGPQTAASGCVLMGAFSAAIDRYMHPELSGGPSDGVVWAGGVGRSHETNGSRPWSSLHMGSSRFQYVSGMVVANFDEGKHLPLGHDDKEEGEEGRRAQTMVDMGGEERQDKGKYDDAWRARDAAPGMKDAPLLHDMAKRFPEGAACINPTISKELAEEKRILAASSDAQVKRLVERGWSGATRREWELVSSFWHRDALDAV